MKSILAVEIARELDRRALLASTRGDRSLSDSELAPVIEVVSEMLPRRRFIFHSTMDIDLTSDRHRRGGDGVDVDDYFATSEDEAREMFKRENPKAFLLSVEMPQ